MLSNSWLNLTSGFILLLQVAALGLIISRRAAGRWPFLTAAIALDAGTYITCSLLLNHIKAYAWYFFIYWGSQNLQALLHLGIARDVARSFPDYKGIPRSFWLFANVFALSLAVGAASYAWTSSPKFTDFFIELTLSLNRAVAFAWMAFLLGLLLTLKLLGMLWSNSGALVTWAMSLRICGAAFVAELLIHPAIAPFRETANILDTTTSIGILLLLCVTFFRYSGQPLPTPDLMPQITRHDLESIQAMMINTRES